MRIPLAMMLAAVVAVSPVSALAQDNAAATTADAANLAAPAPEDANAVVTDEAAATDIAIANEAAAMPAPAPRSQPFPWGVIGLIGLIGLLGSRRG